MDDRLDALAKENRRQQQEVEGVLRTIIEAHARWGRVAELPAPTADVREGLLSEARLLLGGTLDAIQALAGLTSEIMEECNERRRMGQEMADGLGEASVLIGRAELMLRQGITLFGRLRPADPEARLWCSSALAFIGDDGPPAARPPEVVH